MRENKMPSKDAKISFDDSRTSTRTVGEKLSVKDIAEMAGTSVATVSRVINQNGRFSKETEKRVREVIERYHYQPNQLARGLRVKQTQVIGILVPDITNSFFSGITKVVQEVLQNHGYMTLICSTNENREDAERYLQMMLGQKVSGIIYVGGAEITETRGIPTVYIDRDPRNTTPDLEDDFELIECDNIQGGYLAGKELIEKGARRIAFVCFDRNLSTIRKRLQGFQTALKEYGIVYNETFGVVDVREASMEEGERGTREILERDAGIDGIFYGSDMLAIGGLKYLQSVGIPVPDQIRLVGFDDIPFCKAVYPGLTTVHQPLDEIGRLAAERILDMISGGNIRLKHQRIPVHLVVRGTT